MFKAVSGCGCILKFGARKERQRPEEEKKLHWPKLLLIPIAENETKAKH